MIGIGHRSTPENGPVDDATRFTACPQCDLLVRLPDLDAGCKAACPRCATIITVAHRDGLQCALALSLAAIAMLVVANLFPFLSFRASGLEQVMTLPQSAGVLYEQGNRLLAAFVLLFIIAAPALLLSCLVLLLAPVLRRRPTPGLRLLGRVVAVTQTWCMVEVFLVGVLVSFIKIAAMATVVFGMSFWAFVGAALCLTGALSVLDRHQLWSAIEAADA